MISRKDVEGGKCGLQDQGSQRSVSCKKTNCPTTERLTKAKDTSAIDAGISCYAVVCGIHRCPNCPLGWQSCGAAEARVLDQQNPNAARAKPVESGKPIVYDFAIAMAKDHDWLLDYISVCGRR